MFMMFQPYQPHYLSLPTSCYGKVSPVQKPFQLVCFNCFKWIHHCDVLCVKYHFIPNDGTQCLICNDNDTMLSIIPYLVSYMCVCVCVCLCVCCVCMCVCAHEMWLCYCHTTSADKLAFNSMYNQCMPLPGHSLHICIMFMYIHMYDMCVLLLGVNCLLIIIFTLQFFDEESAEKVVMSLNNHLFNGVS